MKHIILIGLMLLVAACSRESPVQPPNEALLAAPKDLAETAALDALALKSIAQACEAKNFDGFLAIFTNSPGIREKYSAREIVYVNDNRSQTVLASDNYYYPLVQERNTMLSTSGFPIKLVSEARASDEMIVKWEHLPLDPTASFDEAQRKAVEEKGVLAFVWAKGCWRLTSDRRTQ
jgi:hypothetical protein